MFGIGFDFDHTLGLDHQLERTALLNVFRRDLAAADLPGLSKAIDAALHDYRSGQQTLHLATDALFAAVYGKGCETGLLFEQFVDEALSLAPAHVTAVQGARELLARLDAAGVRTAILTNGWNPLQQKKADLIGYEGAVIVSDDLGIRKPDPRAFEVLAAALELPPERIIYVGDSPEADVIGARNAGMQAVWFDWEQHVYDASLPSPHVVIHRLDEVDGLVFSSKK